MHESHDITIGQLARRAGVSPPTLRYYESLGLIASRRTAGNQRRYPRRTLRRVAFIRAGQRMGLPLARIAEALAELPDDHPPTTRDWQRVSAAWHQDLQARIDQLVALRDAATDCIGCGCLSVDRCTLVNPEDTLGTQGPGARNLLHHRTESAGEDAGCEDDTRQR
ncbi:redox-sensitive transcriptional activator SoxR [Kytococcus sedentarius]|uniref:MerR family transcriptional regulator, redox-sensitive transcriptional activator SoxR n=2 Tax=Kytococcus TaxID=57499 RepID=A0A212TFG5_9MICO|nr:MULTISPECIES: redox-sensitive transcriptional activator SoxR [Kytococcus]ACV05218.1 redox-sensitive transcriptional activator SoxR [Kytococcus sedentarius DSM 20547]QQB63680.1 redox-sensitive transcriptional activator SoxR [Kytococcus sedentarius]SNC64797.1 MerR family transcriptional regulator, redox-sensitive transcriptional activator SoxR [Kytococcus aerolatus]